ncbi:hypothetical protein EST38_g2708 [Candolleomyces aberdarensis]|uniref:Uncharacterized protein n=1 Tax=Candolleomyces aberdarensis TaxID=2316362 RepID=A0A4Q2DW34_9AGAR|nr:hypothetical protein EST38_g2708 [Candolleomyces aberdarensis]
MTASSAALIAAPARGADQHDPVYYWETVQFKIDGHLFKLPRYHFIVGSDFFAAKYLEVPRQENPSGFVDGERENGVDGYEVLSTTSDTPSPNPKLHGDEVVELDGVSAYLIQVGRRNFVPQWVVKGYKGLIKKQGAITEDESELIGYKTSVRLYIIRHDLASLGPTQTNGGKGSDVGMEDMIRDQLALRFGGELDKLGREAASRRGLEEIEQDIEESKERDRIREEEKRIEEGRTRQKIEADKIKIEEEHTRQKTEADERRRIEEEHIRQKMEAEERRRVEEEHTRQKMEAEERMKEEEARIHREKEEDRLRKLEEVQRSIEQEEQSRLKQEQARAAIEKRKRAKKEAKKAQQRGNAAQLAFEEHKLSQEMKDESL